MVAVDKKNRSGKPRYTTAQKPSSCRCFLPDLAELGRGSLHRTWAIRNGQSFRMASTVLHSILCCSGERGIRPSGAALAESFASRSRSNPQIFRLCFAYFRHIAITVFASKTERGGFEPPVPCGTTVFETARFNRSRISPGAAFFIRGEKRLS